MEVNNLGYKEWEKNLEARTSTLITIRRVEYEELLECKKELGRMMDVEKENQILSANMEALMMLKDMSDVTFVDDMVFIENKAKTSQGKRHVRTLWNKWVAKLKEAFRTKA